MLQISCSRMNCCKHVGSAFFLCFGQRVLLVAGPETGGLKSIEGDSAAKLLTVTGYYTLQGAGCVVVADANNYLLGSCSRSPTW